MTLIIEPSKSLYPVYKVKDENPLENLFKLAEAGDWDAVYNEIAANPQLLNATFDEGPDAGKTVLLIAASKIDKFSQDGEDQAFSFIKKLMKNEYDFNLDAAPLSGDDQGKSVMWLMMRTMCFPFDMFHIEERMQNTEMMNEGPEIIVQLLKRHPDLNINAAPLEGSYKGISLFLFLLLMNQEGECMNTVIDIVLNTKQDIFYSLFSCEAFTVDTVMGLAMTIWGLESAEDKSIFSNYELVRNKLYDQLLKMIEFNPQAANIEMHFEGVRKEPPEEDFCDDSDGEGESYIKEFLSKANYQSIENELYDQYLKMLESNPHAANIEMYIEGVRKEPPEEDFYDDSDGEVVSYKNEFPNKALEFALICPPSPERNKLVVYLILSGAEPSIKASEGWKKECETIKTRLENVFKSAYTVGLYQDLTVEEQLRLLPEIRLYIAFKMIWAEFPELLNFPFEGLKNKLFKPGKD